MIKYFVYIIITISSIITKSIINDHMNGMNDWYEDSLNIDHKQTTWVLLSLSGDVVSYQRQISKESKSFSISWATDIWNQFSSSWSFEQECHQFRTGLCYQTSRRQTFGGTLVTIKMVSLPSAYSASTTLSRGWQCTSRRVDPSVVPPRHWEIT